MITYAYNEDLSILEGIVQKRLCYLKCINPLYYIAFNNLIQIGKRSNAGIFVDANNWFDLENRTREINIQFTAKINKNFNFEDKELLPKYRNQNNKFDFKLSIKYYEKLFSKQIFEIRTYLKKGVDTKVHYSFFDEYIDAKGKEKYTSYKLMPKPLRSLQIKLIYFYRFLMIKLKRRTHLRTGKHKFYKTYNDYSNHEQYIFQNSQTMLVDSLKKNILDMHRSFNEVEIDEYLKKLEDSIRRNYDFAYSCIMHNFKKEAYERARPWMQMLFDWEDTEKKPILPRLEDIDI